MNNIEIAEILKDARELYFVADREHGNTVRLVFAADKEEELSSLADELGKLLLMEGSYLEVDLSPDVQYCHLMICVPSNGNPMIVGPVRCRESNFKELEEKAANGEKVSFGFYIYSKEIAKTEEEIEAAKAVKGYDEMTSIDVEDSSYVSVSIFLGSGLLIKTERA